MENPYDWSVLSDAKVKIEQHRTRVQVQVLHYYRLLVGNKRYLAQEPEILSHVPYRERDVESRRWHEDMYGPALRLKEFQNLEVVSFSSRPGRAGRRAKVDNVPMLRSNRVKCWHGGLTYHAIRAPRRDAAASNSRQNSLLLVSKMRAPQMCLSIRSTSLNIRGLLEGI